MVCVRPSSFEQLLAAEDCSEDASASFAEAARITLYQAGKALRILGVDDAPLSRKRGPHRQKELVNCTRTRKVWKSGIVQSPSPFVEVAVDVSKNLLSILRKQHVRLVPTSRSEELARLWPWLSPAVHGASVRTGAAFCLPILP